MVNNYFVYNGIPSTDFQTYVNSSKSFGSPKRKYKQVKVEGRNGALIFDLACYDNVTITYDAYIIDNFNYNIEALRDFLNNSTGYCRLEDNLHPDEYRLACYSSDLNVKAVADYKASFFEIKFNCKPQRFLKSGDDVINVISNSEIMNPTQSDACPIIKVWGHGELKIGNCTLNILEHTHEYLIIDSEMQDCYFETDNMNQFIVLSSGNFPKLKAGSTGITFDNTITKVEIIPRWWRL